MEFNKAHTTGIIRKNNCCSCRVEGEVFEVGGYFEGGSIRRKHKLRQKPTKSQL